MFDAHFMLKLAEFLVVLRFNQDVITYCNVVCVVDFLVKKMFHDFHDLLLRMQVGGYARCIIPALHVSEDCSAILPK